jgi:hypothetical protein
LENGPFGHFVADLFVKWVFIVQFCIK